MKVLITGGAGFVGANLALYFKERDYKIVVLDNLVRRGSERNLDIFKEKDIKFIHGDIRCKEDLANIGSYDVICECSAQPSAIDGYDNPYFDFSNNTIGLINVLEYARQFGGDVIFWSTNKVYSGNNINVIPIIETETRYVWDKTSDYKEDGWNAEKGISEDFTIDGQNHSIYGLSKVSSDLACQEYYSAFGVKTVINRFSCLAGARQWGKPAQGWASWWAIAGFFGLPLTYFGWKGKQVRDVLFIDDICNLIELEIKNIDKIAGEVFNVGGGMEYTLSLIEATQLMEEMYKTKLKTSVLSEPRKSDQCIYISDILKIKKNIDWKPTIDIITGYESIIKWVESNKDVLSKMYL